MTAFFAVKYAAAVTLISAALITSGMAQGISNNLQSRGCGENKFPCKNGGCIPSELLCDGRADCSDQSDETEAQCAKPGLTCPVYTFRCNYGACVNGDAICNGVMDCIDNSDETLPKCSGMPAANPNASCGVNDFRCLNGQCINSTSICDGVVDCADGSDETIENCGSYPCNQFSFRCNYGACIDGDMRCNNVTNCADGSDEDPMLCGRTGVETSTDRPVTPTPTPTPKPTPTPTPSPFPPKASSCLVPPQPTNGQWKLHKSLCGGFGGGNVDCDISQGIKLEPGSLLIYSCASGYRINGTNEVYCGRGGNWAALPVCTVCGRATTHQTPFVTNGAPARLADFPWHATLYMQKNAEVGAKKEFLCGATIIQKNVVLTAAHCIYDEIIRATVDPKKLFIMTGNTFRDYDSSLHEPLTVMKRAVKNVYRKCEYYGLTGNYASDIALLELEEPFQLSRILLPACLDVAGDSAQILEAGSIGKVAGFGRTATGASSGVLQTLEVPYVPYGVCKGSIDRPGNEIFIGNDKFCAGYNNGSAVCDGDSGGGLVFQKGGLWYVMGIVSVGLGVNLDNGERTCDRFSYSLYTKVPYYMDWIRDTLSQLETSNSYPSCS